MSETKTWTLVAMRQVWDSAELIIEERDSEGAVVMAWADELERGGCCDDHVLIDGRMAPEADARLCQMAEAEVLRRKKERIKAEAEREAARREETRLKRIREALSDATPEELAEMLRERGVS